MDYQDRVRFGSAEPDDDGDELPCCPDCGHEFTHAPTYTEGDPADPDLFWVCPRCGQEYTAEEVYGK